MAAIGSIRKQGVLLMVIIGFALLLFLLTGLFDSSTLFRIFKSEQYTVGKIDGESFDESYRKLYDLNTALLKIVQKKESFTEVETYQIHQITWEQMVTGKLIDRELEKLGIVYHPEMITAMIDDAKNSLTTQQPHPYMGAYAEYLIPLIGMDQVLGFITNIDEYKNIQWAQELYVGYQAVEERIVFENKMQTYLAMANGALYFSNPLAEQLSQCNASSLVSLLSINPAAEAFKEIVVTPTDKEMKSFYESHKYRYEIKEDFRDIDMAVFPIQPTVEDKAIIEANVREQFELFTSIPVDTFNKQHFYSNTDSTYHKKGDPLFVNTPNGYVTFAIDALDSLIFNRPVGSLVQPYNMEENMWFFGKSFGTQSRPDSVLVAFLVVDFKTSQNPNGTRTKKQARHESDSLKNLLTTGQASIFQLMPNYLAGRQATDTTAWYPENQVGLKLYNDLLATPNGGFYTDNINSGFIVYQVLSRTAPIAKTQYVMYSFDIKPSEKTIEDLRAAATQLAQAASSAETLVSEANNRGVRIVNGRSVTSMTAAINDVQNCRAVVYWAFNNGLKKDAVSDVMKLADQMFVVASINNTYEKGVQNFESVKQQIQDELTVTKKVEAIESKVKEELKTKDVNTLASQYGSRVMDSVRLSFTGETYQNFGMDNTALGKLFANEKVNANEVIAGKNMVYVVYPYTFENQPSNTNLQAEKSLLRNIVVGRSRNEMVILEGLRDNTKIWDNRSRFYQ